MKNIKNKVWKALFVAHPATMAFSAERSKSVLQRLKKKSEAGIRSIPVPDFVLDEMTNIQTDENGDLYWEKNINDIEGYMEFLDSFIGGALE